MYNTKNFKTSHPLTFGLSLATGIGVILMILALGFGVVQTDANGYVIGMVFAAGLIAFVTGAIAWVAITRPFTHFDDINQPLEDDHGHSHTHVEVHADTEHSIVPADAPAEHH
ncbi:MAG: hypothetical protein U0670_06365 [Anaerolineae bacterium]